MTVRDSVEGPRRIVPRSQWGFARADGVKTVVDPTRVYMAAKFEPGKIYEVVYTAQDPPLVGLGPAAIRDVISMLKYKSAEPWSIPPARSLARRRSASAERPLPSHLPVLRVQQGRRQPQGVRRRHRPGGGRRPGQFQPSVHAQPSRDGHPHLNFFYPTDIFPFTDVAEGSETGLTDGLLTACRGARVAARRRSSTRTRNTSTGAAPRRSFTRRSMARATHR